MGGAINLLANNGALAVRKESHACGWTRSSFSFLWSLVGASRRSAATLPYHPDGPPLTAHALRREECGVSRPIRRSPSIFAPVLHSTPRLLSASNTEDRRLWTILDVAPLCRQYGRPWISRLLLLHFPTPLALLALPDIHVGGSSPSHLRSPTHLFDILGLLFSQPVGHRPALRAW